MKVTVIATGSRYGAEDSFFDRDAPSAREVEPVQEPQLMDLRFDEPAEPAEPAEPVAKEEPPKEKERVPFYRKVLAQSQGEDPGGYGPNWSNVDDFDIPTVLRKQMD